MNKFACMNDCIHLHACRRVQAIGRKYRLSVPRYCTEDCDCYLSADTETDCITIHEALNYARQGATSIKNGYDEYDVYAPQDLQGRSLGDILDDLFEEEE